MQTTCITWHNLHAKHEDKTKVQEHEIKQSRPSSKTADTEILHGTEKNVKVSC